MSRARRIAVRVALALSSATAIVAATEAALRCWPALLPVPVRLALSDPSGRLSRADSRFLLTYRPGLDTWFTPTAEMSYRVRTIAAPDGAVGLRDDGWSGRPYAVAVGDSFTAGMGVEDDEPWSEVAERRLGRDVVNLGFEGYGSQQELAMLREVGLPLKPEWALFFVNFNDPGDCLDFESIDLCTRRQTLQLVEARDAAKSARFAVEPDDAALTFSGWVAPLPRLASRAPAVRLRAASSPFAASPETQPLAEGEATRVERDLDGDWTLVALFGHGGKTARAASLLRVAGKSGKLEVTLTPENRLSVALDADPPLLLTTKPLIGTGERLVAITATRDGALRVDVTAQASLERRTIALAKFEGPLRVTSGIKGKAAELHEVRLHSRALTPLEALALDEVDAGGGPTGSWVAVNAPGGARAWLDAQRRLHVSAMAEGRRIEAVAAKAASASAPTHLAFTLDRARGLALFVDGELSGGTMATLAAATGDAGLAIGRMEGVDGFLGTLGPLSITAAALAPDELRRAAQSRDGAVARAWPATTAAWSFTGADNGVFADASGHGNGARLHGIVLAADSGAAVFDGRGGLEVPRTVELAPADRLGVAPTFRAGWRLPEVVALLRHQGPYAAMVADPDDALPFRDGAVDQVFRKSAVEGRLFFRDRKAGEFVEGVGAIAATLARADADCRAAGVRLVVVLGASKEAVYFPRAKALFGDDAAQQGEPDWILADVQRWCAHAGIPTIPLLEPLRAVAAKGENLYFRVDPHWNKAGHAAAGAAVADALRALAPQPASTGGGSGR
jgi:hypothetical protein